jgi:hypothetical protein
VLRISFKKTAKTLKSTSDTKEKNTEHDVFPKQAKRESDEENEDEVNQNYNKDYEINQDDSDGDDNDDANEEARKKNNINFKKEKGHNDSAVDLNANSSKIFSKNKIEEIESKRSLDSTLPKSNDSSQSSRIKSFNLEPKDKIDKMTSSSLAKPSSSAKSIDKRKQSALDEIIEVNDF